MIINHNMSAEYANRVLKFQNWELNKNIEKLSSGLRINRAGDDASGLAVSEKLRSQIRGLNQAERCARDPQPMRIIYFVFWFQLSVLKREPAVGDPCTPFHGDGRKIFW